MALTKEDWFKIGKDIALTGSLSSAPREGSWQRYAWDEGWKAGTAAREQAPTPARVIGLKVISVRGPLYPPRIKHKARIAQAAGA